MWEVLRTCVSGQPACRHTGGPRDGNAPGKLDLSPHHPQISPTPITCPANASAAVHHDWGSPRVALEARSQGADSHPLLLLHSPQKVDESGGGRGDAIIWPAQVLEVGHQPPLPGLGKAGGLDPLSFSDPWCLHATPPPGSCGHAPLSCGSPGWFSCNG